jgi:hypothetical protein
VRSVASFKNKLGKDKDSSNEASNLYVSRSSVDEDEQSSSNSETRNFEDEHGIKSIPLRHKTRNKLIIKVKDSGIGIKK